MGNRVMACHCCGLVQEVPPLGPRQRARCPRCGAGVADPARRVGAHRRTVAASLAALVLFPPAVSLPIMTVERFGHASEASIWSGALGLLADGQVLVGLVVFTCSVVLPLAKLGGLLAITLLRGRLSGRLRAQAYRWIEWAGRWGMLDVLLISVVVAWIKIGDLVQVRPGPAALAFTLMVLTSLVASAWFDPHALWDEESNL